MMYLYTFRLKLRDYLSSLFLKYSDSNVYIISKIGIKFLPIAVKLYSVLGGTTAYT